jgi:hypothetical protein
MKYKILRVISIAVLAAISVITIIYLSWVATPFDSSIAIENYAGITKQDIDASLSYARSRGQFSDDLIQRLSKKSKWKPWNRGIMYMRIEGETNNISVSAGYHGGGMGMDGGGIRFIGHRTPDGWHFEMKGGWML